jgi:hypothetical protein
VVHPEILQIVHDAAAVEFPVDPAEAFRRNLEFFCQFPLGELFPEMSAEIFPEIECSPCRIPVPFLFTLTDDQQEKFCEIDFQKKVPVVLMIFIFLIDPPDQRFDLGIGVHQKQIHIQFLMIFI